MDLNLTKLCFMTVFGLAIGSVPAQAGLYVTFDEGAPKDRFQIENVGNCTISDAAIVLDLSTSDAGLIFDVTDKGAGVEVFQPFEIVEGAERLASLPTVLDGHAEITLDVAKLAPGETIAFTIDVDDTIGQREITVSGSEIDGAMIAFSQGDTKITAPFATNAEAALSISGC